MMTVKNTPRTVKDTQRILTIPPGWSVQFVRWRGKLMVIAVRPECRPRVHVVDGRNMRPFRAWKEIEV